MIVSPESLVIVSFAIGGGFGKLADAVIDREVPAPLVLGAAANVIACGTLGLLAWVDAWAAVIVLGIFLGVLLSGKVDSWLHALGAALFLGLAAPTLLHADVGQAWPVLAIVVLGSCADELLHDRRQTRRAQSAKSKMRRVLQYRVGLDLALLALVFFGWLPLLYCIAMWTFDAAYIGTQLTVSAWPRLISTGSAQHESGSR